MSMFTHVDAIDASNYLQAVAQPNGVTVENFIMKVTGFSDNGAVVMPKGFDTDYGLYLTLNAIIVNGVFETLNATLWADPKNNDGTPSATTTGIGFSNGMSGDIALATGTMVSAELSMNPTTQVRSANFVESLTPTLEGSVLSGGSLKTGSLLQEQLTTPPSVFQSGLPGPNGSTINLVNGGSAVITLDEPDNTILVPNIPSSALHRDLGFIYGHGPLGHIFPDGKSC